MSAKVKFFHNSSNMKLSDNSSVSPSSVKTGKKKSFLASVLTPSRTKKWITRNKSTKSSESVAAISHGHGEIYKDLQVSDNFSEPGYASIQDLHLKQTSHEEAEKNLSERLSQSSHESSQQLQYYVTKPNSTSSIGEEPLYASVNKQTSSNKMEDSGITNIIQDQKEEIKHLVERLRELANENRELHKNMETVIREEKWKEESLHSELKLKITQLEADTHKEVKCLSDQIQTLQTERKVLTEQIHILHEEKKSLQLKLENLYNRAKTMVPPDFLQKTMEDHEKLMNQLKRKQEDEIKKLKKQNDMLLESKSSLMIELEGLKEEVKQLTDKNESLMNSEKELLREKTRILLQLEESNQMHQEAQNMLLSLLKIAENIAVERDILMNKASYQDHQQKLLQTSIVDYSLNMGRLQEHISNLSKAKLGELQKLKTGELQHDESLKNFYGKQLDLLQSKVLNQNDTITDLQTEKSKLELQLEHLWETACLGKPKLLEEIKYSLQ